MASTKINLGRHSYAVLIWIADSLPSVLLKCNRNFLLLSANFLYKSTCNLSGLKLQYRTMGAESQSTSSQALKITLLKRKLITVRGTVKLCGGGKRRCSPGVDHQWLRLLCRLDSGFYDDWRGTCQILYCQPMIITLIRRKRDMSDTISQW